MKIAFLEPLGIANEELESVVRAEVGAEAEMVFFPDRVTDAAVLTERAAGAEVVVLSNLPFRRDVIERLPELKMICVAFTGVDHVDLDCCREKGVAVCNCAGYSTAAVADLAFGLLLALERNIPRCDGRTRELGVKDGLVGEELEGKTFGIVGLGAIGQRVARIAQAFGCRVLAWNRSKKDVPGVEQVELDTLLRESDAVSVHVAQTADTVGLIGARELALMKPSAFLINTARGPVVDSAALSEALKNGTIRGAGVDVFNAEPPLPADEPLLNAPNCILTPHVGFATREAFVKRAVIVGENLKSWMDGELKNRVL